MKNHSKSYADGEYIGTVHINFIATVKKFSFFVLKEK